MQNHEELNIKMKQEEIIDMNKKNVYMQRSKNGYGFTYFAKRDFKKDELVMSGIGKIIDHQTAHCSVQIGHSRHYLPTKWTGKYWNHSCESNTYVKTRPDGFPDLVALRNIKKDEEITYFYWMTEFMWTKGVDELWMKCKCGSKNCVGKILSYSDLSPEEKADFKKRTLVSQYLLAL